MRGETSLINNTAIYAIVRQYMQHLTMFTLDELEVLQYRYIHNNAIVVPQHCINQTIANMHCHPLSGHFGVNKTIHKTKQTYYWLNMSRQIKHFITSCITCQKFKNPQPRPQAHLQPITTSKPFETINIDVAGPLTTTKHGKRYILVAVDHFSKYVSISQQKQRPNLFVRICVSIWHAS